MEEIQIPKKLEQKIVNNIKTPIGMELKIYLHRTKKKKFAIADCFSMFLDFDKIPEDKRNDVDFINWNFKNDIKIAARNRKCVQKYGTGYISFIRPQFEGDEKNNGTDKIYFDNKEMMFMKREPKRSKKKKEEA